MNPSKPPSSPAATVALAGNPVRLAPDASCDACGTWGAFEFDGMTLCPACCATRGSCCAECERPTDPTPRCSGSGG